MGGSFPKKITEKETDSWRVAWIFNGKRFRIVQNGKLSFNLTTYTILSSFRKQQAYPVDGLDL